MPVQHAVVAFPSLALSERVESVRRRFDPLATLLSAHVTLVFPFADPSIVPSLEPHIASAIAGLAPFDLEFSGPVRSDDDFLFLYVTAGAERLVALHDRLYTGPLAPHRSLTHVYRPHITIGRLAHGNDCAAAVAEARSMLDEPLVGRVDSLAIFRLDEPLQGIVTSTISLTK